VPAPKTSTLVIPEVAPSKASPVKCEHGGAHRGGQIPSANRSHRQR